MFRRLRERFGAKTLAIGVAVAMLGGGVALALPDEAIEGQETAAANQAAAEAKAQAGQDTAAANQAAALAKAAEAQENAANQADTLDVVILQEDGPPDVVVTFLEELEVWVTCIQDGAAAHAEQQSNADTRIEDDEYDEADKLTLCGEKPVNPNDANEDDLDGQGRLDDAGPPEDAGKPDDAGPPEDAGRPDDAGPDN